MTDSEKLDRLLSEMSGMKSDIQSMKSDIQGLKSDMQNVQSDIQSMKSDIQGLKSDMQNVQSDIQSMKSDIQGLKQKVSSIEVTLEYETNPNIKAIAEGHLDLSRKLGEALKVEGEKEMLIVRVNIMENEMQKIKDQLGQTA